MENDIQLWSKTMANIINNNFIGCKQGNYEN